MDEIEGGAMDCLKIFQNKNVGRSENTNELVEPFARMLSVLDSAFWKSQNFFPSSFFSNGSYGLSTCFWTCTLFIVQFSRKGSSPFMWHSFRENAHLVLAFKIFFLKCKGKKKVECSLGKASWKMRRKNKSIFSNQICRCKQFHTRNVINNG